MAEKCVFEQGNTNRQNKKGSDQAMSAESLEEFLEQQALEDRLNRIQHKILVMSGKGGVGKSTVAVNLAISLARQGKRVGLLDVDIHGPSIPRMLKLDSTVAQMTSENILPVEKAGLKVMSIGFLLQERDAAVIWRGPRKMGAIKQFFKDVVWGDLDYLVIDSPPGTGDEPLSVAQLAAPVDGTVIVTTPQDVATADVRKSIKFCHKLQLPVLGVLENMSGYACPECGTVTNIFKSGGGERMAKDMGVPFLGRIPIDPAVGDSCDEGKPFVYHFSQTETGKAFERVAEPILALNDGNNGKNKEEIEEKKIDLKGEKNMRIAMPLTNGELSTHFGHCEHFALFDVDEKAGKIVDRQMLAPPAHEPGVLPRWLQEQGASMIIAGGMGQRAQSLFLENKIKVVVGATGEDPEKVVMDYIEGNLKTGVNICDH